MSIVLASASPRRGGLLRSLGLDFKVMPPAAEECSRSDDPRALVLQNAGAKAAEIFALCAAEDIVIGADTVVSLSGKILGKPADEGDAFLMLSSLSGRWHEVYTGLCVMSGGRTARGCERTRVKFCRLSPDRISRYIATREPMDKAGAYGIQHKGALLVERIEGDYFNVVGLPLRLLSDMLPAFGINLL